MARGVTGGSSVTVAHHADLNVAAGDFTLSLWVWLDNLAEFGTILYKGSELSLFHPNSGGGSWGFNVGGDFSFQAQLVSITTASWWNAVLRRSGTAVTFWLNGTQSASWTGSGTTTNSSDITFGPANGGGDDFDGRFAEFALWNDDVSDADIVALSKCASPDLVRAANLRCCFPFLGNGSTEISTWRGHSATISSATKQDHPRIFYPVRNRTIGFTAGGGTTTTLTPANASAALTGFAPLLSEVTIPGAGSIAATGQAPAVGVGLNPANASLSLSANVAITGVGLNPANASLTLTGNAPLLGLIPGAASLTLTGFAPSLESNVLEPDAGSLILTGLEPTLEGTTTTLEPAAASLALTGFAISIPYAAPGAASLTVTGNAPLSVVYGLYGQAWTYDVAELGGRPVCTLEVYARATTGTIYARVWDVTSGAPADGSMLSTAGTSFAEHESAAFSMTDGHEYRIQFGHEAGDAGEFLGARLSLGRPYA